MGHTAISPNLLDNEITVAEVKQVVPSSLVKTRAEDYRDSLLALPTDAKERKAVPLASGVLDYFPDALIEVARVSKAGNDQHNPGQPLHWSQDKSTDHADCILRHLVDRGTIDTDGHRHAAKVAWRALALLQMEIQAETGRKPRGAK